MKLIITSLIALAISLPVSANSFTTGTVVFYGAINTAGATPNPNDRRTQGSVLECFNMSETECDEQEPVEDVTEEDYPVKEDSSAEE